MIIGITGGTGFIGSALASYHSQLGDTVRVLSRKNIPGGFKGDLLDKNDDLSDFLNGLDILYHCAAEIRNESLMYDLHVEGTKRLVTSAKKRVKKWVQLSSVGVYGQSLSNIINEDSPMMPDSLYEKTKAESDEIVINSDLNWTIVRPSIVFGRDMKNNSIRNFLYSVSKKKFFFIGDKSRLMNLIFIDDLIMAMNIISKSSKSSREIFIINKDIKLIDIINSVNKFCNRKTNFPTFPEKFVKFFVQRTPFVKYSGLTLSRVNALTNNKRYISTKAIKEFGIHLQTSSDILVNELLK